MWTRDPTAPRTRGKSVDLNRIAAITALSMHVVRKIDEGRFEDLPGGVYAGSYVRTFAKVVGVPPETIDGR